MSNLVKRVLSAIILAPIFLYVLYIGGIPYFALVTLLFIFFMYEWSMITKTANQRILWFLFGLLYLGFACVVMLMMNLGAFRSNFLGLENFPAVLFIVIALVWINDISSYFVGRAIGGPKLAPKISPNKTWSGAIGGVFGCLAFFFVINFFTNFGAGAISDESFFSALIVHILIPIIAQLGDLFESWIKRKFGVKDSGNIIPGHGGLLDRFDGLILVLNVIGIIMLISLAFRAGAISAMGA
jgi:phosphatidate cytidylyltransferase